MHYHPVRKTGGRGLWLLNKLRGMLVRPALGPRASGSVVLIEGHTMGTHYRIRLPATAARHDHAELRAAIQVLLRHLDKGVFSTWEPSSELSRFNQLTAPAQFSTSTDMLALTRMAQTVHELSQGAFDPTVGALVDLWGFGPTASTGRIPAQADIERNRKLQGFEQLRVDETSGTMFKSHPVTLDYSAIAKGYGLDRVAALLEEHGLHDYLVEIGGELLACGEKAPGQEWRVGVEAPTSSPDAGLQAIGNSGKRLAIAASGDYLNFFEHEGQRYCHEIDPATGWPVQHSMVAVTVLHDSAAMADALATAMMVMGPEASLDFASRLQLPIYLMLRAGSGYQARYSDAFAAYLRKS